MSEQNELDTPSKVRQREEQQSDTWLTGNGIAAQVAKLGVTAFICLAFWVQMERSNEARREESQALQANIVANREESREFRREIATIFKEERDHDNKERMATRAVIEALIQEIRKWQRLKMEELNGAVMRKLRGETSE